MSSPICFGHSPDPFEIVPETEPFHLVVDPQIRQDLKALSGLTRMDAKSLEIAKRVLGKDPYLFTILSKITHIDLYRADVRKLPLLLNYCSSLTELHFSDCFNLDDRMLKSIAQVTKFSLQSFGYKESEEGTVSKEGFSALATAHPRLKALCLGGPSIEWFDEVHRFKQTLTDLNLAGCVQFKDDDLQKLAMRCNKLVTLNLEGCRKLTQEGFDWVHPMFFPELQYLYVWRTPELPSLVQRYQYPWDTSEFPLTKYKQGSLTIYSEPNAAEKKSKD